MRFINKIKEYVLSFIEWLKGVLVYMKNEIEDRRNAEYEFKKFALEKTIDVVKFLGEKTVDGVKFLGEKTIDGVKAPFKNQKNMRIAGIVIIGVGGSLILASYVK